jgi:hypothetical protein
MPSDWRPIGGLGERGRHEEFVRSQAVPWSAPASMARRLLLKIQRLAASVPRHFGLWLKVAAQQAAAVDRLRRRLSGQPLGAMHTFSDSTYRS